MPILASVPDGRGRSLYGLDRSRLKGHEGARIQAAWGILAYNLDTFAIRTG